MRAMERFGGRSGRVAWQFFCDLAAREGVRRLWLFTPEHASFYARLGWRPQGSAKLRGVPVQLMDIVPA